MNLKQNRAQCVPDTVAAFTLLRMIMSTGGLERYALRIAKCVFSAVLGTQIVAVFTTVRTVAPFYAALYFL